MRESVFYSSLRSFFVALFATAGLLLGLFLMMTIIGSLAGSSENEPEITYKYTPSVQPNAQGVRKVLSSSAPVILKVNIHGVIGTDALNQRTVTQQLIESRERIFKDNRVKALLLDIQSPGGGANDADGIYHAIQRYKKEFKVPVYAFVDGLCASGGVYVAVAADKIFATDSSIIGSVGVITPPFMNFTQLIDKIGVQSVTLYEGKGKDNMNPLRPWKKGEEDNLKEIIGHYYQSFVDIVAANRPNMSKEKLVDVYGANIYPASLAKEFGYIDEVGISYGDVLTALAKQIGIEDDYYQVVELQNTNWFAELFRGQSDLLKGRITHQVTFGLENEPKLQNQFLYLYRP